MKSFAAILIFASFAIVLGLKQIFSFIFSFNRSINGLIVFSAYENCWDPMAGPAASTNCIPQGENCTVAGDVTFTCDKGFFCCNAPITCTKPPMRCVPNENNCTLISNFFECGPGSVCCYTPDRINFKLPFTTRTRF